MISRVFFLVVGALKMRVSFLRECEFDWIGLDWCCGNECCYGASWNFSSLLRCDAPIDGEMKSRFLGVVNHLFID
jgi:hypothetical protein